MELQEGSVCPAMAVGRGVLSRARAPARGQEAVRDERCATCASWRRKADGTVSGGTGPRDGTQRAGLLRREPARGRPGVISRGRCRRALGDESRVLLVRVHCAQGTL